MKEELLKKALVTAGFIGALFIRQLVKFNQAGRYANEMTAILL